jgi:hypothetical protein
VLFFPVPWAACVFLISRNACLRTQGNTQLVSETVLAASILHQADFNARGDDGYTAIIKAAEYNKLAALVRAQLY